MKNDIFDLEDFLDLGTYPIFLAREITFSLKVALSKILHLIPYWHYMK